MCDSLANNWRLIVVVGMVAFLGVAVFLLDKMRSQESNQNGGDA